MAKTRKEPKFTANVRVVAVLEMPLAAKNLEEAAKEAAQLKSGRVLQEFTGILDFAAAEVVSINSSRWLDE